MSHKESIPAGVTLLAGAYTLDPAPWPPFDASVLGFLNALSENIRALPRGNVSEEMRSLGFWLRRAHLLGLREAYGRADALGLGISFHIAPANVPLLFAWSCAIGLLAGNACRVRVSGRRTGDAEQLCALIRELLADGAYAPLAKRISVLAYDRSLTDLTQRFSSECSARVVWGGDRTVEEIRRIPIRPRAVELSFPDRASLCVLGADAVLALPDEALCDLAARFYNDTYAMDQNACSCPKLVCWEESDAKTGARAASRFWNAAAKAARRYRLSEIKVTRKYGALWEYAGQNGRVCRIRRWDNLLYVLELSALSRDFPDIPMQFGSFLEYHMQEKGEWADAVSEKTQTVTFFGVSGEALMETALRGRLRGVSRIAPVGQALFMDLTWDGKNLIDSLSRRISR